jgi:hypothetical protein
MTQRELESQLSERFGDNDPNRLMGCDLKPSRIYLIKFALNCASEIDDPLFPACFSNIQKRRDSAGSYIADVVVMDEFFIPRINKQADIYCGYWLNVHEQIEIEDDERDIVYVPQFATVRQFDSSYPRAQTTQFSNMN